MGGRIIKNYELTMIIVIIAFIFFISLLLALQSMKDFDVPAEIKTLFSIKKLKGTIVFFKNKVKHYHN